jgi:hypothetical protein
MVWEIDLVTVQAATSVIKIGFAVDTAGKVKTAGKH